MQLIGKFLVVIGLIACAFKVAVNRGLHEFDLSWFQILDEYGDDAGWMLRFLISAAGLALVLFGKWSAEKGL